MFFHSYCYRCVLTFWWFIAKVWWDFLLIFICLIHDHLKNTHISISTSETTLIICLLTINFIKLINNILLIYYYFGQAMQPGIKLRPWQWKHRILTTNQGTPDKQHFKTPITRLLHLVCLLLCGVEKYLKLLVENINFKSSKDWQAWYRLYVVTTAST